MQLPQNAHSVVHEETARESFVEPTLAFRVALVAVVDWNAAENNASKAVPGETASSSVQVTQAAASSGVLSTGTSAR